MKRVTGLGGIFFKSDQPSKLSEWYKKHLGLRIEPSGVALFKWREQEDPQREGYTVWSPFENDTDYFGPGRQSFMINYRVENLQALLDQLRMEGVTVDQKTEESEFGKFGWIMDPEGNRVELWEPPSASE